MRTRSMTFAAQTRSQPLSGSRLPWSVLAGLVLLLPLPATLRGEGLSPLYSFKTNLTAPNAFVVADLVHTPAPEVIVTDVKGRLRVYSSETGEEMARANLGDMALSAPNVGDFLGNSRLQIVVGTQEGDVVFFEITDRPGLTEVARGTVGTDFSLQPTIVTLPAGEDGVVRDRAIFFDGGSEGNIIAVDLDGEGEIQVAWTYASRSRIQSPLALGKVRSTERLDLIGGTSDGYALLLNPYEYHPLRGTHDKILVQERAPIPHTPMVLGRPGSGRNHIVITLGSGEVILADYARDPRPTLNRVWTTSTRSQAVAPPVLLDDGRGHPHLLQATSAGLMFIDPATGEILIRAMELDGVNTPIALLPDSSGFPALAFGLKRTIQFARGYDSWLLSGGHGRLTLTEGTLRHDLSSTLALIAHGPDRRGVVLGLSPLDGGFLYAFDTGISLAENAWPTRTPWMTNGGSPHIGQTVNRDWAVLEHTRRREAATRAAQWEAELEAAIAAGEWDEATDLAIRLVEFDPFESRYGSLRLSVAFKRHFFLIITISLAAIALIGFLGWRLARFLIHRRLRLRAEGAVARNDYEAARRSYQLLLARRPRDTRTALALARVLLTLRDFQPGNVPVYAQAHHANPRDNALLHAYTRALLAGQATTPEAMAVYEKCLAAKFPEPQLVEYGIGRCLIARGEYEEAARRLRSALRAGLTTEELYASLCDVYLRTNNTSAKALPVYQQQYPHRREDPEFLKILLAACIDAKKNDSEVETLCHSILEFDSSHIPAYLQLALFSMQKNHIGPAIDEVHNALSVDPNHPRAISLLAYCHLMEGRRDEEALQAYLRALGDNPSEKEILRMVAAIYFERGVYNEESIAIYHQSLEANPGDVTTLRALAQTARLTGDHRLAVRAIESLLESGQSDTKLVTQLANAYVKLQVTEPRAERALREALRTDPENPEYLSLLSRVLVAQESTDVESIRVYEKHLSNAPKDIAVGRQLARAFISANRYEHALTTTKRFLAQSPEDEELQRLNALASLYDNKIDEAVSEYQRILERNPGDEEAKVNLALAYGQKMRTDEEALDLYNHALRIRPDNDLLHLAMARVHVARSNAAAAVESYKKALEVRPDNERNVMAHVTALLSDQPDTLRVRWFLVELLVTLGHFREALDQLEYINQNHPGQGSNILRVLEVILGKDGNNVRALTMSGKLLLAGDQLAGAIDHLDKAYALQPTAQDVIDALTHAYKSALEKKEDPDIRMRLGKVHYNEQEFDDAIGCFQKTAQDYRHEAESNKMLGRCFTGKGMLDIALQEYRKLVVDEETKELLYDLAQRYEAKKDLVGAKTVYRQLFAADIGYKDVKTRFEMLSGSTSDPMSFEKTNIVQQMSEAAARRYELLDELGRGAMGIVYRARDKELEEIVALKILPDNMSNNPEAVRRFKVEARNARKLSHPNIVRIHDIGEEMGRKYISMEYVDGSDLKKKIKSADNSLIPRETVIKYLMATIDALGYAHRLGIVHRDIKPANIMLTSNDEVKVTDFGIAKMMDSATTGGMGEGTMVGAVIGTPLYMSPEQVQGIAVDNRADLYSFGVMAYEMLSGRPPFTQGDLAYQHLHKEPAPIEGLPGKLWDLLAKCLAKEKEARWESAEQIHEALREIAKEQ